MVGLQCLIFLHHLKILKIIIKIIQVFQAFQVFVCKGILKKDEFDDLKIRIDVARLVSKIKIAKTFHSFHLFGIGSILVGSYSPELVHLFWTS